MRRLWMIMSVVLIAAFLYGCKKDAPVETKDVKTQDIGVEKAEPALSTSPAPVSAEETPEPVVTEGVPTDKETVETVAATDEVVETVVAAEENPTIDTDKGTPAAKTLADEDLVPVADEVIVTADTAHTEEGGSVLKMPSAEVPAIEAEPTVELKLSE